MNLILEKNGDILLSKHPELGKRFKLLDRLRGNGIGTTKLHYVNGVAVFDELQLLNQDTAFVNFEPTTQGFILHFNKTNRIRAYGIPFQKIKTISIKRQQVKAKTSIFEMQQGTLCIETNTILININIPIRKIEKVILFFETYLLQDQLVIL